MPRGTNPNPNPNLTLNLTLTPTLTLTLTQTLTLTLTLTVTLTITLTLTLTLTLNLTQGTDPAVSDPLTVDDDDDDDDDDDVDMSDYLFFSLGLLGALFVIVGMVEYIWYLLRKEKAGNPAWQPLLGADVGDDDVGDVAIKIDSAADDE